MSNPISSPSVVMPHQTVVEADAVYKKVMLHILPLLMLTYIVAYIDRSNVGFAKLGFMRDLGLSDAVFGVGAGIFYAGYMLFEIPSNLMLARIGARKTFLRIMVLWVVCAVGLAYMSGANTFFLWRFLLGASEAGLFPGVLLYLTYWVPASRRARFTAFFMAAMPISGIISSPLSGLILHNMEGVAGMHGWQWLFLIEGTPALLVAAFVFKLLKDRPSEAPWLTPQEIKLIEADLEADRNASGQLLHKSFRDVLRSPRFYLLMGMGVALLASISNIFFWLPTILQRSGVANPANVGFMSAAPFAVAFVCQYLVARRSDLRGEYRWHAATCAVVSAIGWCVLPAVSDSPALSLVALVVTVAGTFAATAPFWSMPGLYLGKNAAAGGIALISTLAGIGSLITPMIIGWLNQQTKTLAAGQYFLAALLVIGAITIVAVGPHVAAKRTGPKHA